ITLPFQFLSLNDLNYLIVPCFLEYKWPRACLMRSCPPACVSPIVGGKESSIMASARVPVPIRTTEDLNSFRIAMRQFDTAAEKCGLDPGMREVLRRPRRALSLSLPVKMDDGTIHVFDGFRV